MAKYFGITLIRPILIDLCASIKPVRENIALHTVSSFRSAFTYLFITPYTPHVLLVEKIDKYKLLETFPYLVKASAMV